LGNSTEERAVLEAPGYVGPAVHRGETKIEGSRPLLQEAHKLKFKGGWGIEGWAVDRGAWRRARGSYGSVASAHVLLIGEEMGTGCGELLNPKTPPIGGSGEVSSSRKEMKTQGQEPQ